MMAGMKRPSPDRTGVMIVRLWMEGMHESGLRARITQTLDSTDSEIAVAAGASAADICESVKQWVDAFVEPGTPDSDDVLIA